MNSKKNIKINSQKNFKKLSKSEIENKIKELTNDLNPNNIKKIKKLAMSKNIKLTALKKTFCKKCLSPFNSKSKIRIKGTVKTIRCKCGYINRYKIK